MYARSGTVRVLSVVIIDDFIEFRLDNIQDPFRFVIAGAARNVAASAADGQTKPDFAQCAGVGPKGRLHCARELASIKRAATEGPPGFLECGIDDNGPGAR